MVITLCGDISITQVNRDLWENGNVQSIFGKIPELFRNSDRVIVNLECALTEKETAIRKFGPNLKGPAIAADILKEAGVTDCGLSNNHIYDFSKPGMDDTLRELNRVGLNYTGVGENEADSRKDLVIQQDGKTVRIITVCEHEYTYAMEDFPGARPYDPYDTADDIRKAKAEADYVIVMYHGGKEMCRYPSPRLRKLCRAMITGGADLVLCQHSHCIGCEEKYQNGTIVYGQGNFLFDRSSSEFWQTSLLVALDEDFQVSYIPLAKQGAAVHLAKEKQGQEILRDFQHRSEEIREAGFIRQKYEKFAHNMLSNYLFSLSGIRLSFFLRALNKLSGHRLIPWLIKKRYPREQLFAIRNFIECEAHREVLLSGLKENKHNAR